MEPITIASAFATIVSLIASYKSERRTTEADVMTDFTSWLSEHGFIEIQSFIKSNARATQSIEILLREHTDTVLAKIEHIDDLLACLVSGIEIFGEVVDVFKPHCKLSTQAINLLRQVEDAQATAFMEAVVDIQEPVLIPIPGGNKLEYDEPRFIEDDLSILVEIGLLRLEYTPKGNRKFIVTRAASEYIKTVDGETETD